MRETVVPAIKIDNNYFVASAETSSIIKYTKNRMKFSGTIKDYRERFNLGFSVVAASFSNSFGYFAIIDFITDRFDNSIYWVISQKKTGNSHKVCAINLEGNKIAISFDEAVQMMNSEKLGGLRINLFKTDITNETLKEIVDSIKEKCNEENQNSAYEKLETAFNSADDRPKIEKTHIGVESDSAIKKVTFPVKLLDSTDYYRFAIEYGTTGDIFHANSGMLDKLHLKDIKILDSSMDGTRRTTLCLLKDTNCMDIALVIRVSNDITGISIVQVVWKQDGMEQYNVDKIVLEYMQDRRKRFIGYV